MHRHPQDPLPTGSPIGRSLLDGSLTSADLTRLQEAALAAADDATLVRLRAHALEDRALPRVVDGATRGALVAVDPIATTWQAWDRASGAPLLLRLLRVRWREDPLMQRRLAATPARTPDAPGVVPAKVCLGGDWPHLRWARIGPRVQNLAPPDPDTPADDTEVARLLVGGLRLADALDAAGLPPRADETAGLLRGPDGLALAWLDPAGPSATAADRLRVFTAPARARDPDGRTPLGALAHAWAEGPAPTTPEAMGIAQRALADHLAAGRHALARASSRGRQGRRAARLHAVVRRLSTSLPPPTAHVVLRVGHDQTLFAAWSDGQSVRAGTAATPTPRFLPPLWTPDAGLDPTQARAALRAWRDRASGDSEHQAALQSGLGGTADDADALVRWIAGQSRLRRADLLLRAWRRQLRPTALSPRSGG